MAALRGLTNILGLSRIPFVYSTLTSTRNSFLSPLSCFPTIYSHGFHMTSPGESHCFALLVEARKSLALTHCNYDILLSVFAVDGKYHHITKKRKLRKLRMAQLRARFEVFTVVSFTHHNERFGVIVNQC